MHAYVGVQKAVYLKAPEGILRERLLARGLGRTDDNTSTIRKRFSDFEDNSLPVIEHLQSMGKLATVDAARGIQEVYRDFRNLVL